MHIKTNRVHNILVFFFSVKSLVVVATFRKAIFFVVDGVDGSS